MQEKYLHLSNKSIEKVTSSKIHEMISQEKKERKNRLTVNLQEV